MTKRYRKRSRRNSRKIPLAPIVGLLASPPISQSIASLMQGNVNAAMGQIKGLVGCDWNGNFNGALLAQFWTPILAGIAVHYIASKTGLNRAISKVPLVQI